MTREAREEWQWDLSHADVQVFRNGHDLAEKLGQGKYDRAVIYAHGDPGGLMPKLDDWKTHVRPYALAKAFGEGGIREALLLGCNSKLLAETTAHILRGFARVGGIDHPREDEINLKHTRLTILNMIIWGFDGTQ